MKIFGFYIYREDWKEKYFKSEIRRLLIGLEVITRDRKLSRKHQKRDKNGRFMKGRK